MEITKEEERTIKRVIKEHYHVKNEYELNSLLLSNPKEKKKVIQWIVDYLTIRELNEILEKTLKLSEVKI